MKTKANKKDRLATSQVSELLKISAKAGRLANEVSREADSGFVKLFVASKR